MSFAFLILLGPPGSGKGTQAKRLAQKNHSWVHVSTGDLFRAEIASGSPLGMAVKSVIDSGKLVSDDVTTQVFESQVNKILEDKNPDLLILDGYPRNKIQAESFKKFARTFSKATQGALVEFKMNEQALVDRLSGRLINPRNGRIYHVTANPPKKSGICDDDGGPLIQRSDDKPEIIRSRVRLYEAERDAIVGSLNDWSSVTPLDADRDSGLVFNELLAFVEQHIKNFVKKPGLDG